MHQNVKKRDEFKNKTTVVRGLQTLRLEGKP